MTRPLEQSTVDFGAILRSLDRETEALLDRVQGEFLEMDLQGQPVLEGLTGGHVLTYLAREADRMADELVSAAGHSIPVHDAARQWDVAQGGLRPGAVLIDDVLVSAERLRDAMAGVHDWSTQKAFLRDIPGRRLVQLMIHHADLARPWDSVPDEDAAIAVSCLRSVMPVELSNVRLVSQPHQPPLADRSRRGEMELSGDPRALLAWASGRIAGVEELDASLPYPGHRTWF